MGVDKLAGVLFLMTGVVITAGSAVLEIANDAAASDLRLTSLTEGRLILLSKGILFPSEVTRALMSAKRESSLCSRHICFTDSRVYVKPGTHRTFLSVKERMRPVEDIARTGMSPMHVARDRLPFAARKISLHGRLFIK